MAVADELRELIDVCTMMGGLGPHVDVLRRALARIEHLTQRVKYADHRFAVIVRMIDPPGTELGTLNRVASQMHRDLDHIRAIAGEARLCLT